jgi:hypothetical protein
MRIQIDELRSFAQKIENLWELNSSPRCNARLGERSVEQLLEANENAVKIHLQSSQEELLKQVQTTAFRKEHVSRPRGVESGSVAGQLTADLQNLGLSEAARQRVEEHIKYNAEQTKLAVLIARWWDKLDTLTLHEFVSWPKQLNWAEVHPMAFFCSRDDCLLSAGSVHFVDIVRHRVSLIKCRRFL